VRVPPSADESKKAIHFDDEVKVEVDVEVKAAAPVHRPMGRVLSGANACHFTGAGMLTTEKPVPKRAAAPGSKFGKENMDGSMRPKTPAKAKTVRERFGSEHPAQSTNGHQIGEEHLWTNGLVVSPDHTHEMMNHGR